MSATANIEGLAGGDRRPAAKFQIVAFGSSTGGPDALLSVLPHLAGRMPQPILITQHMPAGFTASLARHISQRCDVDAAEAVDGQRLSGGRVYVAPGGSHMILERRGPGNVCVRLTQDPPENFCRPAVDPMMRSVAALYGPAALAIILTGMGQDGLLGCRTLTAAGGTVIAQDQASSVVWGMPGAVANAGLCREVLPLDSIGPWVHAAANGRSVPR